MSYTAGIETSIAEATTTTKSQPALSRKTLVGEEMVETPSATELFSYAVCCAGQGLLWALYLVLVITVSASIGQGILQNLP